MADKSKELLAFFKQIDLSQYIEDDQVKDRLTEVRERIETIKEEGTSTTTEVPKDVDPKNIAGATRIKLVVVGDGAVGKTSLLISYATKKFPTEYVPTVFENYTAKMTRETDTILLHLWDTAGQEDYDRLRPLSYPSSDVILLCFSTVNKGSYESIRDKWYPEVHHYVPKIPHILVGTKVDLRDSQTADPHTTQYEPIHREDGEAMAKHINASTYTEVSAKTRKGLAQVFETAVKCVLESRAPSDEGSSTSGASNSGGSSESGKGKKGKESRREKKTCLLM
eukprot:TRINITY_DN2402_c0_g1_i1.p1 TRINITY_DN2402_c0_g1~~TRINITY_DN2402_c0_g1_i1.p1  ORF type:complete len:281 (-),score=38.62 TRINITY_DN2402_c0_g1_i1:61-903(-)